MNTQVLSDKMLLNRYLTGDRSAISQLIGRHSNRVRDYIRMMVKDHDLAEGIKVPHNIVDVHMEG